MRKAGVACYRLYERDISDQPAIVDWYDGDAVVWTFPRTRDETPAAARAWEEAVVAAVAEGLDLPQERIHAKHRARQSGTEQYLRLDHSGHERLVTEQDLRFAVNLVDFLDTGLFLDHRLTRARVRAEAAGRDMLNLFGYTGAFACYAAAGGAASTTGVDLNAGYCDWARRNLALNAADAQRHRVIRADCLAWLDRPRPACFDLIVCDPPTFSNSKKMHRAFSVERDHCWMLRRCAELLRPDGLLYFSTNKRGFRLAADALEPFAAAQELTPDSIPEDFRNRRIHRCWRCVR